MVAVTPREVDEIVDSTERAERTEEGIAACDITRDGHEHPAVVDRVAPAMSASKRIGATSMRPAEVAVKRMDPATIC